MSRRCLLRGMAVAAPALLAPPALASLPASPDPRLLAEARAALARHAERITQKQLLAIVDFGRHSATPRFFLLAPETGLVASLRVAHGRGSDPAHSGFLQRFSAEPGSAASSAGAYLTDAAYSGQHGASRRLIGLDPENRTAEARAIVIHGAWYCEPPVIRQTGKLGRSEGCFAFSAADVALVLDRLPAGSLIYANRA